MCAIVLTLIPLPEWAKPYRPEWIALLAIYWSITTPKRFNLGSSWIAGLVLDVLRGSLLGQHAIGFALSSFFSIRLHQRMRAYPFSQQAFFIALFLLPYMSINLWIYGMLDQSPDSWLYWMPVLTSALSWPLVVIVMRAAGHNNELR